MGIYEEDLELRVLVVSEHLFGGGLLVTVRQYELVLWKLQF